MKRFSLVCFSVLCSFFLSVIPAHADYMFSGSGTHGTLVSPSETWTFNYSGTHNWGSPGVGAGVTAYGEPMKAYGMILTFSGGGSSIDPASIALGNASACAGSTGGGTTFCTIGSTDDIWEAFLVGADSIEFLAQSPTFYLTQGQDYFVNVMFDGGTPTSFTGSWLTSFTPAVTPEPSSLLLVGTGALAVAGSLKRRLAGRTR